MIHNPPPLTGRQLIEFKSIISSIEADLRQYERALEIFGGATEKSPPEMQGNKPPVRVLLTGVPNGAAAGPGIDRRRRRWASSENCTGLNGFSTMWTSRIPCACPKMYHLLFGYDIEHPRR